MKKHFLLIAILTLFIAGEHYQLAAQGSNDGGTSYYIDVHKVNPDSVTYGDVVKAHAADLQTQGKYDVSFLNYWVDEENGYIYCLSEAKDADSIRSTHEEAHGLVPNMIYEVVAGEPSNYSGNGYLFLDIHELGPGNVTAEDVVDAHKKDLETQSDYNVNFINYWVDEEHGMIFCLSEAPDAESVVQTHKHAHGLIPGSVHMVVQGQ